MKKLLPLLVLSSATLGIAQERLVTIELDTFTTEYQPQQLDKFSYENGLNNQILSSLYNEENSEFVDVQRQARTFDANGQLTLNETFLFLNDGTELLFSTSANEYAEGLLSVNITADFNQEVGALVNSQKTEYTYTAEEEFSTLVFSNWNDSTQAWELNQRQSFVYNEMNLNTEVVIESYDAATMGWTPLATTYNVYDENMNLVEDSLVFQSQFGPLVFNANAYSYDESNREIEQVIKGLVFSIPPSTVITGRVATSYEGESTQPAVEITANYVEEAFVDTTKSEYTYTMNDNIAKREDFFSLDQGASYVQSERLTYTYESTVNVTELNNTVSVYPNPAIDKLFIATAGELLANVTVMNMNGQVVISEINPADNVVEVSALTEGVYLIKVAFENGAVKTATFKK